MPSPSLKLEREGTSEVDRSVLWIQFLLFAEWGAFL